MSHVMTLLNFDYFLVFLNILVPCFEAQRKLGVDLGWKSLDSSLPLALARISVSQRPSPELYLSIINKPF